MENFNLATIEKLNSGEKIKERENTEGEEEIFERITQHSLQFDKETSDDRRWPSEEILESWQVQEWNIGDCEIRVIGVSHVPETFLEFRQQIEKVIQESDVVVNEFAPEALGFYDKKAASRLSSIKSKVNERYNLEELRQLYLKKERSLNIGLFHHEIELLAAKYKKDMAISDLTLSRNPESFLQDAIFTVAAEEIEIRKTFMKRIGAYAATMSAGVASLIEMIEEVKKPSADMSRRKFLKLGLAAGASAVLFGTTHKIFKLPAMRIFNEEDFKDEDKLTILRDAKLADSLRKLAEKGYKKIAFIYGTGHLKLVKRFLDNPELTNRALKDNEDVIERNNPDAFRVYRLAPGDNTSEKFVASKMMVWKQL